MIRWFRRVLFTSLLLTLLCSPALAREQTRLEIKAPDRDVYTARQVRVVSLALGETPLESDVPAYLADGRTMVPVRIISEALDAKVEWDDQTRQVTITLADRVLILTIGSPQALLNGQPVSLYDQVPAALVRKDGIHRTMVPLRAVSELLGAQVVWDPDTHTASIWRDETPAAITAPRFMEGNLVVSQIAGIAQPVIFSLEGRVVIDFPGARFSDSTYGKLTLPQLCASAVRYNQYDREYAGYHNVARIVFDMTEEKRLEDLVIEYESGLLSVTVPPLLPEEPLQDMQPEEDLPVPADPPALEEPESQLPQEGAVRLVLDAGHGGTERGAIIGGAYEKDIDLAITLKTGALLADMGYEVIYTRTEDVAMSLSQRAEFANRQDADLFICIHANSYPYSKDISGVEVYYLPHSANFNSPGRLLAKSIQASVTAQTGAVDRGARPGDYYVLQHTKMTAVLIETGYMTNSAELRNLLDPAYQDLVAAGIADGINQYLQPT